MVAKLGINEKKKLTNHSWRKTTTTKMRKAGASRSEIIEVTGHTNDRGLDPYDMGDEVQQRNMSHVISGVKPSLASSSHTISRFQHEQQQQQQQQHQQQQLQPHPQQQQQRQQRQQQLQQQQIQPCFNLLSEEVYTRMATGPTLAPILNFWGTTTVNLAAPTQGNDGISVVEETRKRKRVIISSSSESSQE